MAQLTRGPLPPGVYWRRRAFVLALAASLVFVAVSAVRGGGDGGEAPPVAQQVAQVEPSETVTVPPQGEKRRKKRRGPQGGPTYGPTYDPSVLVEPEGWCKAPEVLLEPQVDEAVAGRDVTIGLSLRSTGPAACLWRLSPKRIVVRITQGDREVWTTRECPGAIPEQVVTVRDVVATVVEMTWTEAKESDPGCPAASDWARAGDYSVAAATLGGEPGSTDFELVEPTPETVGPETDGPGQNGPGRSGGDGQGTKGQGKQGKKGQQGPRTKQGPRQDQQGDGQDDGQDADVPIR